MDVISNPELHNLKKTKLASLKARLSETSFYTFSCDYHGIQFTLKTTRLSFVEELKNYLPISWLIKPSSGLLVIELVDPLEMSISPELWSDEISQDCYSYNNNQLAVQRDFAAEIVDGKVNLICAAQIGDGFYNFLRWFLSEKLMDLGKFVVHSSCVLRNAGQAYLFLGHSGAGKTTITRLSSPRQVLGDDMNIVSLKDSTLYVEAGAIGGQFNSMVGYGKLFPVASVFWLKQSMENKRVTLERSVACQKILASFANLHWSTVPSEKIEQLINFTEAITKEQLVFELSFTNNEKAWELLDP